MRANNVLALIHAQEGETALKELTAIRTAASVPFGCRYRFIDFTLSNLVNAGITQVGIITRNNFQSLSDHVGSGKPWDLDRKREGMFILPPFNTATAIVGHDSILSSLYSISDFLEKTRQEYVIMTNANTVYNIDFNDLFKFHSEKGADITLLYKQGRVPSLPELMILDLDEESKVQQISMAQPEDVGNDANYSFNILVMRKSLLEYLVRAAIARGETSFEKDVIQANLSNFKIYGYKATGFAETIDSLQTYYNVSMSLLKKENRDLLFNTNNPIKTKVYDNVPTTYGVTSKVSNSLLADGCTIHGTVENCILFRNVYIEEGAVIKNSIIMQGTRIQRHASLNYVITDKDTLITPKKQLSGDASYPVFISKGITV
ncbi:MAG: glucose-1-phosphate adenylyltransferase subunit GlgD [Ruminococcaceae bacterium]|nr:glucose-1-phosphate adenylyltransferase subunit GlgD [Oscillospiraceae bacterium]